MMANLTTTSMDVKQRRHGTWTRRAIVAVALATLLVSVIGSTSVADALVRVSGIGTGIAIAAVCCVGWYLVSLAALDAASRQFGHAWRNRRG